MRKRNRHTEKPRAQANLLSLEGSTNPASPLMPHSLFTIDLTIVNSTLGTYIVLVVCVEYHGNKFPLTPMRGEVFVACVDLEGA